METIQSWVNENNYNKAQQEYDVYRACLPMVTKKFSDLIPMDGKLHHLVITRDTSVKYYVDGKLI